MGGKEIRPLKYFDPRTLAKLQGLQLRARHIVEGYVAGQHRSPMQGFSIEFAEHRTYSPGDELRHVDWKVFGRTDKYYVKRYVDETNLVCYLAVDVSESMSYRGDDALLTKLDYAKCVAAAIGWIVLKQLDAVAMVLFDEAVREFVRPGNNASQWSQLLQLLDAGTAGGKTATGPVFHELAERFPRRGVVVLISDFFDDPKSIVAGLRHFRHRQHDVVVMHIMDPTELDFPFEQATCFRGLEHQPDVVTEPHKLRIAYLEEVDNFTRQLRWHCRDLGIDYLSVRTDQPIDQVLTSYFAQRRRRL